MTRPYTSTERNNSELFRPEWTWGGDYVFANSSVWPTRSAVAQPIAVGSSTWTVYLEPDRGWRPPWETGLLAGVALAAAVTAALVGTIAASWAQQRRLLRTVTVRLRGRRGGPGGQGGGGLGAARPPAGW